MRDWKDVAVRHMFSGVLAVVLNQATDLKPKLFGTRNPYAVLRMRSLSDLKVWKSSAKTNTSNPTWNEETSFLVQVYSCTNPVNPQHTP
jgi:Ca2+-dependent lipid-binding protein